MNSYISDEFLRIAFSADASLGCGTYVDNILSDKINTDAPYSGDDLLKAVANFIQYLNNNSDVKYSSDIINTVRSLRNLINMHTGITL